MNIISRAALLRPLLGSSLLLALCACSDNNSQGPFQQAEDAPQWTRGEYLPASTFANACASPMQGINPFTGVPYSQTRGTAMHEKMWLRSMSHDLYLWYDQLPDPNPERFSVGAYFDLLKTDFDRFHYATPVDDFYNSSQAGVYLDYGIRWHLQSGQHPMLRIADIDSGYQLDSSLKRGDTLVEVDGVELTQSNTTDEIDIINAGLAPTAADPSHVLIFLDRDTGERKNLMLTARALEHNPLPRHFSFTHNGETFGYLQFDDHSAIAEPRLLEAVSKLRDDAVDELVLDLRYNQGGYLYLASQLSYMIAGPGPTEGMPFISPRYNDKHQTINPIDGSAIEAMPFYSELMSDEASAPLPTLNLSRVYVITSGDTCSASEAIINGLKGVGVEVVQVGNTTCGKPYTFMPLENCSVVYSTVLFSNENAAGFGDYAFGFSPTEGTHSESASRLPGCSGDDDVDQPLGSTDEGLLAAALHWHEHGSCPRQPDRMQAQASWQGSGVFWSGAVAKPAWRSNALMLPQRAPHE